VIRFLFLLAVAALLYGRSLEHFFVSDDFLNLERNRFETLGEALSFFSTRDIDFYRPIPRFHFGFLCGFFGDRVLFWNSSGLILHTLAAWLGARLAASLLGPGSARVAFWTGIFFAIHFIHTESVVWASSVNSVYVTIFVYAALLLFRRARRTGSPKDRTLAVLAFAGALMSQEASVAFFPLLALTNVWWPAKGRSMGLPARAGELLPFAVLAAGYAWVASGIDRGEASPYTFRLGAHVLKNAVFFVAGGFLPLRYWEIRDLWTDSSQGALQSALELLARPSLGVPLVLGVLLLGVLFLRGGRDIRGAFLWILVGALPFLFLQGAAERFHYLPSFGACLALARMGESLLCGRFLGKWGGPLGLAALVLLHVLGGFDRQADWITSSKWTREIRNRKSYLELLDPTQPIEFVGIPGAYRSAWVFRNGFDSMVRMYWGGRPYWREEERRSSPRAFGKEPERMGVVLSPNGAVGMMPEHLLPPEHLIPNGAR
jgi:hypothetical protein